MMTSKRPSSQVIIGIRTKRLTTNPVQFVNSQSLNVNNFVATNGSAKDPESFPETTIVPTDVSRFPTSFYSYMASKILHCNGESTNSAPQSPSPSTSVLIEDQAEFNHVILKSCSPSEPAAFEVPNRLGHVARKGHPVDYSIHAPSQLPEPVMESQKCTSPGSELEYCTARTHFSNSPEVVSVEKPVEMVLRFINGEDNLTPTGTNYNEMHIFSEEEGFDMEDIKTLSDGTVIPEPEAAVIVFKDPAKDRWVFSDALDELWQSEGHLLRPTPLPMPAVLVPTHKKDLLFLPSRNLPVQAKSDGNEEIVSQPSVEADEQIEESKVMEDRLGKPEYPTKTLLKAVRNRKKWKARQKIKKASRLNEENSLISGLHLSDAEESEMISLGGNEIAQPKLELSSLTPILTEDEHPVIAGVSGDISPSAEAVHDIEMTEATTADQQLIDEWANNFDHINFYEIFEMSKSFVKFE